MKLERDAISIRGRAIDISAIPNNAILRYNSTKNIWTYITPLAGTKVYYVADSSGGAVTRKLTFTNGILTSET